MQNPKKFRSASTNIEYKNCPKKSLDGFLPAPKSQTNSSTLIINHYYDFRKRLRSRTFSALIISHHRSYRKELEMQPVSTTSTSFISDFDIFNITSSSLEYLETDYALWCEHCWRYKIKDIILTTWNVYKYTWEVILYIVLTGKRCSVPDIWPESLYESESRKNMMSTVLGRKAHYQQKAIRTETCLLFHSDKDVRHVNLFISRYITIQLLNQYRFRIQLWVFEFI